MTEGAIPIFHVADAESASSWYARLGFEHDFANGLPLYLGVRRGDVRIHLSEHEGDAPRGSLAYLWIDDVDAIAREFGVRVSDQPWAREVELTDPDGNRLRIGEENSPG